MESQSTEAPLKVCPSCAVASRTSAATCPSCGAAYVRERRLRWRWWFAVPIVALAFGAGYAGWKLFADDPADEVQGITFELGRSMPLGLSRPALIGRLGGQQPTLVKRRHAGGVDQTCLYYLVTNQEDTAWLFCFEQGKLATSASVIG